MNKFVKNTILAFHAAFLIFGCKSIPEEKPLERKTSANPIFDSSAEMVSNESKSKTILKSKTIFMIHGMWCAPWVWKNYKTFFEKQGYRCVTPTLRFHDMDPNDTPDPQLGNFSLLDYASDLEKEIKQLDEKPIIMGHSMGGLLAQILGSRGLAKSLVLITPNPPSGIHTIKFSIIKSMWGTIATWGWWRKPHRLSFDASVYGMLHLLPPEEQKRTYSKLVYESGLALYEIAWWIFDSADAAKVDELDVTCPVLVIAGKEDRIMPASVVENVAEKYESVSTYWELESHAHWVLDGEPGWEIVADNILSWLNNNS